MELEALEAIRSARIGSGEVEIVEVIASIDSITSRTPSSSSSQCIFAVECPPCQHILSQINSSLLRAHGASASRERDLALPVPNEGEPIK